MPSEKFKYRGRTIVEAELVLCERDLKQLALKIKALSGRYQSAASDSLQNGILNELEFYQNKKAAILKETQRLTEELDQLK